MKKLNLMALLLGAALLSGITVTSLSAEDMKCGAGKCGDSMAKPASKCGGDKKDLADSSKACKSCDDDKAPASKCGGDKKAPAAAAGKCGTGKCS